MKLIKRALLSVSNKRHLIEFARALQEMDVALLSTGGTAKILQEAGLKVEEVSSYTGFPEILGGRVKTLHPKIHGGILAKRKDALHHHELQQHAIEPIDLLCVNLYPFFEQIQKDNNTLEQAIEEIDIGGVALIRAAAKNFSSVAILTDPDDYSSVVEELKKEEGPALSDKKRFQLATKAFAHTAHYDGTISNFLSALDPNHLKGPLTPQPFPGYYTRQWRKVEDLRYGENPHQAAAFYEKIELKQHLSFKQLQGKPLSYNNLSDSDAAFTLIERFNSPACAIIKHANPCGVALGSNLTEAYEKAFAGDPVSAFGGIIAFNQALDCKTARSLIDRQFTEVVIAPEINKEALTILKEKKNIRVLMLSGTYQEAPYILKEIPSGLLIQTRDKTDLKASDLTVVTKKAPSDQEIEDLLFLWQVAAATKSNAIVVGKNKSSYGIGAGQMSRVDAAFLAVKKARDAHFSLKGAAVASDAFFPFADALDLLAQAGIGAVIQPGGSVKDNEVIAAADDLGISMVFTMRRHFKH